MANLKGKVALVTGASGGIGSAIAKRLAKDGANVAVHYGGSESAAKEVVGAIEAMDRKAVAVQADLAKSDAIAKMFDEVLEHFNGIDIVVNNAGVFVLQPAAEVTEDHIETIFNVNVKGLLLVSAAAARKLRDNGRIINLSSVVATGPMAGASVYAASKAAVEAVVRCQAQELGGRGITVNAVAPGTTDTEMLQSGLDEEARKQMAEQTPLGRLGKPEDIADVVAFLASEDARWVTGATIVASGGLAL